MVTITRNSKGVNVEESEEVFAKQMSATSIKMGTITTEYTVYDSLSTVCRRLYIPGYYYRHTHGDIDIDGHRATDYSVSYRWR